VILLQWEQTETPKPTVQSGWKKTIAFSDAFLPTQKKPKANSAQTRKISLPGFLCSKGRGYPVGEKPFGRIPDRHIAVQRTFLQIERRLKNEFFMANRI
jgi:hypothetical protein